MIAIIIAFRKLFEAKDSTTVKIIQNMMLFISYLSNACKNWMLVFMLD